MSGPGAAVLIVDDLPQNLYALRQTLSPLGITIVEARSGQEALLLTLEQDFALAIIDVQMPIMDGYELAELLQGDKRTSRIPIIFVTAGYSDDQHRRFGYGKGAVDYLSKPFEPDFLLAKARVFLELAEYRTGLERLVEERARALMASDVQHRSWMENTWDVIQEILPDGRLRSVSPSWESAFGYNAQQRKTMTFSDLLAPAEREATLRVLTQLFTGRDRVGFVSLSAAFVSRHGRTLHLEGNLVPVVVEGRVDSVRAICRDVTERREAQVHLDLALSGSGIQLWDWDVPSGRVASLSAEGRARYQADSFRSFIHAEDLSAQDDRLSLHLAGESEMYEAEFRIARPEGGFGWVHVRGRVLTRDEEGRPLRMAGTRMDIDDRKQAELGRLRLLSAEAEARAQREMSARMSHEIRTPMNAILGYVQLLQRDSGLTPEQKAHLETISRSGGHLLTLINAALDLARIEAGQLTIIDTEVRVHDLLFEMERMFRLTATDKGLTLTIGISPGVPRLVLTDGVKVRQVLINLLGNAFKFTDSGGIGVHASWAQLEAGQAGLVIDVVDTGCGIEPEHVDAVFERFGQTESGRLKHGTGLGLTVSRHLARGLGGDLTVTSQPWVRTCFRFELRVRLGEQPRTAPPQEFPPGWEPAEESRRAVVVGFNSETRLALSHALATIRIEVREAEHPAEGLSEIESFRPSLVLVDEGSATLVSMLRARPEGGGVGIILFRYAHVGGRHAPLEVVGVDQTLTWPGSNRFILREVERVIDLNVARMARRPTTAAPVARLPQSLIAELVAAVEDGFQAGLLACISKAEKEDANLAKSLRSLAEQFEYGRLLDLLKSMESGGL